MVRVKGRIGLKLSDLHSGSKYGLWSESDTNTPEGKLREILREHWAEMVDLIRPDFVLVNGDTCEGWNQKEKARYLVTSDLMEQVDGAVKMLRMIKGNPKFIITEGSGYHVGANASLDELVARELDAHFDSDIDIEIEGNGRHIHACHNLGYSNTPAYRTTAIARELMMATINADTLGKFDIILRGHCHYHVFVEYGKTAGQVLPCWKLRDLFAKRKGVSCNPKVGWIVYEYFPDGSWQYDRRRSRLIDVKGQVRRVKV